MKLIYRLLSPLLMLAKFVRQPPGPARESSHVLPRSSACLGLARFHLHQLTCFSNREFITDSTHFHVPTLVPLISYQFWIRLRTDHDTGVEAKAYLKYPGTHAGTRSSYSGETSWENW
jgi:hypothetical protein